MAWELLQIVSARTRAGVALETNNDWPFPRQAGSPSLSPSSPGSMTAQARSIWKMLEALGAPIPCLPASKGGKRTCRTLPACTQECQSDCEEVNLGTQRAPPPSPRKIPSQPLYESPQADLCLLGLQRRTAGLWLADRIFECCILLDERRPCLHNSGAFTTLKETIFWFDFVAFCNGVLCT